MATKDHRLEVMAFGDDATGTVDFTVGTLSAHDLPLVGSIPEVSSGMIRPLEGDVDPVSFNVRVADESGNLTSRLSDNVGRLDQLNRTVVWAVSYDEGSNWSELFTGRIRSVRQENPAVYRVQVTNERFSEAEHEVFTEDQMADSGFPFEATTTIVPEGVRPDLERVHRGQVDTPLPHWEVLEDVGDGVWKMQATTRGNHHPHPTEVSEMAVSVLRDDVSDQSRWPSQNFEHLKFREVTKSGSKPWSGTDRDVVAFAGFEHTSSGDTPANGETMNPVAGLREEKDRARTVYARLDNPTVGGDPLRGFLYMPDRPPSERVPVHIGYGDPLNLLSQDAGLEVNVGTGQSTLGGQHAIADLALEVGDRVSASAGLRSATGTDTARLQIQYFDSGGSFITGSAFADVTSSTYQRAKIEDDTIPANTAEIRVIARNPDSSEDVFARRAMLNKGPTALEFVTESIGMDPMRMTRALYDYFDIGYDDGAFRIFHESNRPDGVLGHPHIEGRGDFWLRVEQTWNLRELTTAIYKSYGLVPFTGGGTIAPRRVMMPQEQLVSDTSDLFHFRAEATASDEANIAADMPVWTHGSDNHVTRLIASWKQIGLTIWQRLPGFLQEAFNEPEETLELAGLDVVTTAEKQETLDHDRIDSFGPRAHDVNLIGQHTTISAQSAAEALAGDIFDRYGDGPVEVELPAVEGAEDSQGRTPEDREPGEWVLVSHEALPNPETGDRTGTRLMQVLDIRPTFGALRVHLLDAGANQQPNTAPSVSLVKDPDNSFRGVTATVSGLDSGTEKWVLWLAAAASEPDPNSDSWFIAGRIDAGTSSLTYSPLPSGNTIWARVQAWERGRTRSGFSDADSAQLDAYTAPTNLSVDNSLADVTRVSWDSGNPSLPTEVRLDRGNGLVREQVKSPGTENAFLFNMEASTAYTVGVRHLDENLDPPGTSTETTLDFNTGSDQDDPDDESTSGNPGGTSPPSTPTVKFT